MMPIIPFPVGAICSVCGKRKATRLCDFPVGKSQYIGHPPRYLMQQAQNASVAWLKVEMSNPNLVSVDLSSFDTSNVTNMSYMFYDCSQLKKANLLSFDGSKLTLRY